MNFNNWKLDNTALIKGMSKEDISYAYTEAMNAQYSEGENFHEPGSIEHDAMTASDNIDQQERAAQRNGL